MPLAKDKTIFGSLASKIVPIRPANPPLLATRACPHNRLISCSSCRLNEFCLPIALNKSEIQQLNEIVQRNLPLKKGDHLYRKNDQFKSVFAVRSGSFKSYLTDANGQEQVTSFHLPGEIIGMDGISSNSCVNSTVALEHASVCEIPFAQLEQLSQHLPNLQHHFFAIMGNEIVKVQQLHMLLSSYTAEQRIASFILNLSTRYSRVSLAADKFNLPMSRGEIGGFVGLTLETVSRSFTALQKLGIIKVNNKAVEILDFDKLHDITVQPA